MTDKFEGFLEVGTNDQDEIVVNHPDLKPDANGVGHIVFSSNQARHFGNLLLRHAAVAEGNIQRKQQEARRKAAESIPVDRSATSLSDGSQITDDHREIISGGVRDGQQKGYVVLTPEEISKGFVRPVRDTYLHKPCGGTTTMGRTIAETYARDPKFYSGTFCVRCKQHFPLDQFTWSGTDEQVGS